jgi:hypothetical protein
MKTFRIYETRPATSTLIYEVKADTKEQAIQMVENGEANIEDEVTNVDWSVDSKYESEEI